MADDPLALETEMREIDEQMRKCQKELDELERSDVGKTSPKQREISRLMEKRDLWQKRWEKAIRGQSSGR